MIIIFLLAIISTLAKPFPENAFFLSIMGLTEEGKLTTSVIIPALIFTANLEPAPLPSVDPQKTTVYMLSSETKLDKIAETF
jgi:hypothetical protein